MRPAVRIVLVAFVAGVLGIVASITVNGPGPLLGTELGQRVVQEAYSAVAPPAPEGLAVAARGGPVPSIVLPGLDGASVEVPGDFAGRPILVNVWASWCGPCIQEMPELERFHAEQGANGTQVVGIALDDAAAVAAFLERVPVSYPLLIDAPGPRDAGVQLGNPKGVLPYSALVSADGRLLRQRIGPFAHGEISEWARE